MKAKKRTTTTTPVTTKATRRKSPPLSSSSLFTSPIISFTPPNHNSPKRSFFDFNLNGFDINTNTNNNTTSTTKNNRSSKTTQIATKSSLLIKSSTITSTPIITISDLKDLVSSHTDSLKRQVDSSHLEILKEFEASHSRISKRFKNHMHTCQQMGDEVDKECKKLSDLISENAEAMKKSYELIMKQAEASTNRLCKTSITDIEQSMEKTIQGLRSRYRFQMTAA